MKQPPKLSRIFVLLSLLQCLTGCIQSSDTSQDTAFLAPYIEELKRETPPKTLSEIAALPKSELIRLHFGYGTGIRNKWLWGGQDPQLIAYFKSQGITHPDTMSRKIIEALWDDLNKDIPAEQKIAIEKQREILLKKQEIFQRISAECTTQLQAKRPAVDRCYTAHSPALNPLSDRPIFNQLVVSPKGTIDRIAYSEDTSNDLANCLQQQVGEFTFSEFEYFPALTLYPIEGRAYTNGRKQVLLLESCNVRERFDCGGCP